MKYNPLSLRITWKGAAFYILAAMLYCFWFLTLYNLIAHRNAFPYYSLNDFLFIFGLNLLPMTGICLVNTCVVFFTPSIGKTKPMKVMLDLICSMVLAVIIYYIYERVLLTCELGFCVNWGAVFVNNVMIFLINEVIYHFLEMQRTLKEVETAKRTTLQLHYDVLKAQINPHFLFNSFNNLYSLIEVDKERAMEFAISLSRSYRYIVSQQNKPTVTLREEMDFANAYINILRIRYNDKFSVSFDGIENIADQEIIPYSLQLLIENVAKHNIIGTKFPMEAQIRITDSSVEISNPIRKKEVVSDTSLGLHYLTELYAMHDKDFQYSEENDTFTAIIPYLK